MAAWKLQVPSAALQEANQGSSEAWLAVCGHWVYLSTSALRIGTRVQYLATMISLANSFPRIAWRLQA